jgi:hypothetical protein
MERLSITGKVVECGIRLDASVVQGNPMVSEVLRLVGISADEVVREGGGLEISLEGDLVLPVRLLALLQGS